MSSLATDLERKASESPSRVFDEAIEQLDDEVRGAARKALKKMDSTGCGARIVSNIQMEKFLPVNIMKEMLCKLAEMSEWSPPAILAGFVEECHRHARSGGSIRCVPVPRFVGRVVSRAEFATHLRLKGKMFHGSRRAVSEFLAGLAADDAKLRIDEEEVPLSAHAAWVTSDHESSGRGKGPFDFRQSDSPVELECALGLTPDLRKPLLLFVYESARVAELLRPTVADAGAYEFFSPPLTHEVCCGRTCPWPQSHLPKSLRYLVSSRRPEAVHLPVPMKVLKLPVEVVP